MPRISRSDRVELWLDRLQRHSQSGQTIAQFCTAEGVSAPSFYQWKQRLAATLGADPRTGREVSGRQKPSFSEVQIVGESVPASVYLPGGIHFQLGTDVGIVSTIVDRVLQHACPAHASAWEPGKPKPC